VWALLRTRRWLSFTATGLLAIVAFGLLSHWQWLRAQEEDAKSDAVAAGAAADPVPLESVLAPGAPLPDAMQWRPVVVSGRAQCDSGFLVRNRPRESTNGFWAVCPLQTDTGAWLWVNRGWMPASGPATTEVAQPAAPIGELVITGRLRASESGPSSVPADLPPGQVTHLDTAVLTATAGLSGAHYVPYIEATAVDPADPAALAPLPLPPADSAQNYSYAGQWLLFAAITVAGWFYFLRREAHENAEDESGAPLLPAPPR
jgi:cytochrome oxidase assembly protein ShyY1